MEVRVKNIGNLMNFFDNYSMGAKIKDIDKRYSPSPSAYNLERH